MTEASAFELLPHNVCEDYVAGFCMEGEHCRKEHCGVDLERGNLLATGHQISEVHVAQSKEGRSIGEKAAAQLCKPAVCVDACSERQDAAERLVVSSGNRDEAASPRRPSGICEDFLAGFCGAGEECMKEHCDMDLECGDSRDIASHHVEDEDIPFEPQPPFESPSANTGTLPKVSEPSAVIPCKPVVSQETYSSHKPVFSDKPRVLSTGDHSRAPSISLRSSNFRQSNNSCKPEAHHEPSNACKPESCTDQHVESLHVPVEASSLNVLKPFETEKPADDELHVDDLGTDPQALSIDLLEESSGLILSRPLGIEKPAGKDMDIDNTDTNPPKTRVSMPEDGDGLKVSDHAGVENRTCKDMEIDDIVRRPDEGSVSPTPPEPARDVPDAKVRPTVLQGKMTKSHWKALRHMAFQGNAFDRLAFKILQELFLSPTVGIGLAHLRNLNKAMENVPYVSPTGQLIADWQDFEKVLPAYEDAEGAEQELPSEMTVATTLFGNNLSYYFCRKSPDEYGAFAPSVKEPIPARGDNPCAKLLYKVPESQNDRVIDDPLFQEIEKLL